MAPWAGRAMRGQQPLAPQDALQQAAVTSGTKANEIQAANLYRVNEGAKLFFPRVGYTMLENINRALLLLVLDKVAHVSEKGHLETQGIV